MKTDAVLPGQSIASVLRDLKKGSEPESKLDPRDISMAELSDMPGWKRVVEYIEARLGSLKDKTRVSLDEADLASIGVKAMVYDIVEGELKGLIALVDGAKKVTEEERVKNK